MIAACRIVTLPRLRVGTLDAWNTLGVRIIVRVRFSIRVCRHVRCRRVAIGALSDSVPCPTATHTMYNKTCKSRFAVHKELLFVTISILFIPYMDTKLFDGQCYCLVGDNIHSLSNNHAILNYSTRRNGWPL